MYVHGARQTDILTRQTRNLEGNDHCLACVQAGTWNTEAPKTCRRHRAWNLRRGFVHARWGQGAINSPKPDNRKSTKLHGKLAMHQHKRQGTNRYNSRIRAAKPRLYFLCRCHWAGFNIGTGLRDGSKAQRRSARHLRSLGSSPFRAAGRCDPIRRLET